MPPSHLDADGARLQPTEAALVKGVEGLVAHDARLQHVAAVPAGQEEGLVHLHRLVWKSRVTVDSSPAARQDPAPWATSSPGVWKLRATS